MLMIFNTNKLKVTSLLLLLSTASFSQNNMSALLPMPNKVEQIVNKKNFTLTPQTVVKTNLPKQAFCLFELHVFRRTNRTKGCYRNTCNREFSY